MVKVNFKRPVCVIILVASYLLSGCQFARRTEAAKLSANENASGWEQVAINGLKKYKVNRCWALTSESGMEDAGQVFVFEDLDQKGANLEVFDPNSTQNARVKHINGDEYKSFIKNVEKTLTMEDLQTKSFDGIKYTVLVAERKHDGLSITKRLNFSNPDADTKLGAPYVAIVGAFQRAARR